MNLVRSFSIPNGKKRKHDGPCANGAFWALEDCNDLPDIHVSMDISKALENGELWVQDAERVSGWEKVFF
jgi:hypothetical protein